MRVGHGDAVDQRRGELLAQLVAPAQREEAALADAQLVEDVLEGDARELAVGPLKAGSFFSAVDERLVRQREVELVGVRLDRGPGDELGEHAVVEPGGVRLLGRDAPPRLPRDLAELVLEGALEVLDADLVRADLGERAAARSRGTRRRRPRWRS